MSRAMAKKRRTRRTRREMRVYEETGPTAETKAKLEADPLRMLIDARFVNTDMERAAAEIRAVYLAIVREVMSKPQAFGRLPGGKAEMPDGLAEAHARRYVPWVADMGGETVDLTLRIAVDRQPAYPVEPVIFALRDYARRMA